MQGRDEIATPPSQQDEYENAEQVRALLRKFEYTLTTYIQRLERIQQRYSLDEESALHFYRLKQAMKKELGYRGTSGLHLVELSHKFTKERLIEVGDRVGLSEADVIKLLPAMAMKLIASEVKFTLSAFKGGLFSKPQELEEALRDVDKKYTQRFGL